jgi:hypothetical protein
VNVEEWRPLPGFEGRYEVSDQGRVYSVKTTGYGSGSTGRILASTSSTHGHRKVRLYHNKAQCWLYVHRLVMLAFVGPCPAGQEVRHLDGDPTNNCLDNLRYGTRSENALDRAIHVVPDNPDRLEYCANGLHVFDDANTYRRPTGRRQCRACMREVDRRRRQRARAAA